MKKWLLRIALFLLVLTLSGATVIYFGLRELGFFREPVFETGAPLLPELRHPAVLVFSKTCLLYTSRAHETVLDLVCRLLLEKKKIKTKENIS